LTADELRRLHRWLSSDEQSVECDLPDLVLIMGRRGLDEGTVIYMGRRKRAAGAAEVLESRPALIGWPSIAASWTARDWILAPG
jgi:hypothetical protein